MCGVCMCVAVGDSLVVLADTLRGERIYSPLNVFFLFLRAVLFTQAQLVLFCRSLLIC